MDWGFLIVWAVAADGLPVMPITFEPMKTQSICASAKAKKVYTAKVTTRVNHNGACRPFIITGPRAFTGGGEPMTAVNKRAKARAEARLKAAPKADCKCS